MSHEVRSISKKTIRPFLPSLTPIAAQAHLTWAPEVLMPEKSGQSPPAALLDKYAIEGLIGSGSASKVARAFRLADVQPMAMKCVRAAGEEMMQMAKQEFEIMSTLSHPNVVRVSEVFVGAIHLYILMEFCDDGDLLFFRRQHLLDESQTICLYKQLLKAVDYLHQKRVVHSDLKPETCLLKENGQTLKVVGFDRAQVVGQVPMSSLTLTQPGNRSYCAPELVLGKEWNERIDIWACGLVAYFMVFGVMPFSCSELSTKNEFMSGRIPVVRWDGSGKGLRDSVIRCLSIDKHVRPSAVELLTHPMFLRELRMVASSSEPRLGNHLSASSDRCCGGSSVTSPLH